MRRVLDSFDLSINRKTYYNLVRNKSLKDEILNNLFKALMLTLKKADFRFNYNINKELIKNDNIRRVLNQIIFFLN
jgi:hypothetical protein